MRFPIRPVGEVEISNIKYVVENTIRMTPEIKVQNEKTGEIHVERPATKEKVGETFIWSLTTLKSGRTRWLKFKWGQLAVMEHVLDGKSEAQMITFIEHAAMNGGQRVWFSGDTCNIETREVLKITPEELIEKMTKAISEMFGIPTNRIKFGGIQIIGIRKGDRK